MQDLEKLILAIFGGVITIALVATFVGKNSQAPQVIASSGQFLSNVVGAAVAPINDGSNGNLGLNVFTNPSN